MANAVIGYGNYADTATLSGGSWGNLDNLKSRYLYKYATSTSPFIEVIATASGEAGVVALLSMSDVTSSDTYRVLGSHDLAFTQIEYDSGTLSTAEQVPNLIHDCGQNFSVQYWKITINASNPNCTIGRLFIGKRFQAAVNISYGASFGYQSSTEIAESEAGVEFFRTNKPQRRVVKVIYDMLSESESDIVDEIMHNSDVHKEVVFIRDPANMKQRKNIYGRLSALNPIDIPYFDVESTGFDIIEIVR